MPSYAAVYGLVQQVKGQFAQQHDLSVLFARCLLTTLETCVTRLPDGTTFITSGDIPAMWLRDSSAQVGPYVPLAPHDPDLRALLAGLIARQARYLLIDPYANAFLATPTLHRTGDQPATGPWVWERKFELDSLCYPIRLWYDYWQATGDRTAFDETVHRALRAVVQTMRTEQRHQHQSRYAFVRPQPRQPSDTLPGGRGTPVAYTGMVWSGFRPSDDACRFGYHIPANMFAAVTLGWLAALAEGIYGDRALGAEARMIAGQIDRGIQLYGLTHHPYFGTIFAYETDGFGRHLMMDDANVPSLLAMPYIGYRPASDPVYQNTRRFALSQANPYHFAGSYAQGVGSPHTPRGYVWHMAMIARGLTAQNPSEQQAVLAMLAATTAGTGHMHESFDPNDPDRFTRRWFGWADSLFAEFVLRSIVRHPAYVQGAAH